MEDRHLPVAAGRRKPGWLSLECVTSQGAGTICGNPTRQNSASLVNIAHLHFQHRSEPKSASDGQLGATIPHARSTTGD